LQNLHNEYPYHVDTLLQLGEILKIGDDPQAASEMIGMIKQRMRCDSYSSRSPVFQHLPVPEPNRACLVGVYAFLIWNNLCDLVYQTPTKSYHSQIPVAFGIPGHVTTKHLPDTPC